MEHLERLALAALVHDLPALVRQARRPASAGLQRALALAQLDDPSLATLLRQAEAAAMPGGADHDLVSDRPLRAIVSRVALHDATEPPPAYYALAPLLAADQPQDALFPTPAPSPDQTRRDAYLGAMLDALDQLAAHVDLTRFDHASAHLLAWLQRYGWCLPATATTWR